MTKQLLLKPSVYSHPVLSSSDLEDGEDIITAPDLAVPLLLEDDDDESLLFVNDEKEQDLKSYGCILGFFVGIGMLLSNLGARAIMMAPNSRFHVDLKAVFSKQSLLFSLIWSIVTAIIVVCILQMFLGIVRASHGVRIKHEKNRRLPVTLMIRLEVRFFLGMLIGAFLSAVTIDVCIVGMHGLKDAILYNVGALMVSLSPMALYKCLHMICGRPSCVSVVATSKNTEGVEHQYELLVV